MSTMIKAGVCSLAATVICLSGLTQADASTVRVINTGWNNPGLATYGTLDDEWKVSTNNVDYVSATVVKPYSSGYIQYWVSDTSDARWITPFASGMNAVNAVNPGTTTAYYYKYTLPTGFESMVLSINAMSAAADNLLIEASLAGVDLKVVGTQIPYDPTAFTSYAYTISIDGGTINAGSNPVDLLITVKNLALTSGGNPTGLIVDGTITAAVPVPAAAWAGMSMLGAMGAFRFVRRRREVSGLV